MDRFCLYRTHAFLALMLVALPAAATQDLEIEARQIANEFVGLLKPALMSAMKSGGPEHAVSVCAKTAPAIAGSLSARTGWQVKRVSLKARNPGAAPDEFERGVLKEFDQQTASGIDPTGLHFSAIDGNRFRYLQAQPVQGVCLTCHGPDIAEDLSTLIRSFYPDDLATGYQAGEVRGAISLTSPLNR